MESFPWMIWFSGDKQFRDGFLHRRLWCFALFCSRATRQEADEFLRARDLKLKICRDAEVIRALRFENSDFSQTFLLFFFLKVSSWTSIFNKTPILFS
ncbi:hypothetical protein Dimus_027207 [Dionaea muscipula]